MKEKHIDLSRFISFLLRHRPETIGLKLDKNGYLNVDDLIEGINQTDRYASKEIIEEMVSTDNKNRYSFNEDKTLIRANQGHSIPVDVDLKIVIPPDVLYHGTATKYKNSILENGLNKRNRNFVHLSENIETAKNVGSRHGTPIIILLDTKKMKEDGIKFFKSINNIWLIENVDKKYIIDVLEV